MKHLLSKFILITTVLSAHAGDGSMPKDPLEGWSKIFSVCTPGKKTFFTQKDYISCIVSYDAESGTYTWTRIQVDPTQEFFTVEETVESHDSLDIFNKMEKKFLQEQEEKETALFTPFERIQDTKNQT